MSGLPWWPEVRFAQLSVADRAQAYRRREVHLVGSVALFALLLLLVLFALLALRRVQLVRVGTQVVLRDLPAEPGRRWRHGVVRYREDELLFFRLASMRPGPDRHVGRSSLEVLGRRRADPTEGHVVLASATVIHFRDDSGDAEIALDDGALTALLSWIESSPPGRAQRIRR